MPVPARWSSALLLGALLVVPAPRRVQASACTVLKPADLTALLGGTVTAKPGGTGCSWTAAGSKKRLLAIALKATGPAAEMAYTGARNGAGQGGKATVTDL